MDVMFILIGASLLISVGFLIAFFWANKKGQYDDTYTPSVRMLFDDPAKKENNEKKYDRMEKG